MMDSLFDISNDELCRIYIDIIKLIELDLIGKTNKKKVMTRSTMVQKDWKIDRK